MTTSQSYTPMRGLVMDFRTDTQAANIGDQFMFGRAFMVKPVTEPGAATTRLYLPDARWYDFWSGERVQGPKIFDAASPLDRMPLYIRAGSILPLGPEIHWSTEKPADPIELRIYRGADGAFTLYEDENDNYNYEKGAYSTIPFDWNEAKRTLTIGDRQGHFPGMLAERTFNVVFVEQNHGTGVEPQAVDKVVRYSGKQLTVTP
jgi:alpha-D-xyloside xylohydrolase